MRLENLEMYKLSLKIADDIWDIVCKWDFFTKDTIGKQFVRAADSIAANISEGYGRYHYGEIRNFNYYARGSLFETKTWIEKSYRRKFISSDEFHYLIDSTNHLGIKLNNYIKTIGKNKNDFVSEDEPEY
jgi:four helix bundle protein